MRLRLWQLILLVVALCAAVLGGLEMRRRSLDRSPGALLGRLPRENAVQLVIDVRTLRDAGLLDLIAGSKAAEESDYRRFVEATGFDYRENLDLLCASFVGPRSYYLLRGNFDWTLLDNYAVSERGRCNNGFCTVPLDRANTYLSFYPLARNVLAMAISDSVQAAYTIPSTRDTAKVEARPEPVWFTMPVSLLSESTSLPAGSKLFASAMDGADRVTFALGAGEGGRFQAKLEASCPTAEKAAAIAAQLTQVTMLVRRSIERENGKPNPADFSGIFTSGQFDSKGPVVGGRWTIERAFLETLAAGNP